LLTWTESGFREHDGAKGGVGETEHESETDVLKSPTEATVAVEVADWPAMTEAGVKPGAATEKSGGITTWRIPELPERKVPSPP
jgi:hypothetical protein